MRLGLRYAPRRLRPLSATAMQELEREGDYARLSRPTLNEIRRVWHAQGGAPGTLPPLAGGSPLNTATGGSALGVGQFTSSPLLSANPNLFETPELTIVQFGGKPDPNFDNAPAIEAAWNALQEEGGGVLGFGRPGSFGISTARLNSTSETKQVTIRGFGPTLTFLSALSTAETAMLRLVGGAGEHGGGEIRGFHNNVEELAIRGNALKQTAGAGTEREKERKQNEAANIGLEQERHAWFQLRNLDIRQCKRGINQLGCVTGLVGPLVICLRNHIGIFGTESTDKEVEHINMKVVQSVLNLNTLCGLEAKSNGLYIQESDIEKNAELGLANAAGIRMQGVGAPGAPWQIQSTWLEGNFGSAINFGTGGFVIKNCTFRKNDVGGATVGFDVFVFSNAAEMGAIESSSFETNGVRKNVRNKACVVVLRKNWVGGKLAEPAKEVAEGGGEYKEVL